MTQKILASHTNSKKIPEIGEIIECNIDLVMVHEQLAGRINKEYQKLRIDYVADPQKIVYILDHWVPAPDIRAARMHQEANAFAEKYGFLKENCLGENKGICHTVLPEQGFIYPGMIAVGSDSHTTTYGAFNCFSTGIGATDVCIAFATSKLWFKVPESIKIMIKGKLNTGVFAKDLALAMLRDFSVDGAIYKSIEFCGADLKNLDISSRITLSNMSVEMGAKNAIFEFDNVLENWYESNNHFKQRHKKLTDIIKPTLPDKDAIYESTKTYQLDELEPMVACPHSPDNVKPIEEVNDVKIDQGFIGSCTNGSIEDLQIAARILKGKKVHPQTRCIIIPASSEIYLQAIQEGLIEIFIQAGCVVGPPTCGPCIGGHLGVLGDDEVAISSSNRNFQGRMGAQSSKVYLASPASVATSVIEGKIATPKKYIKGG